MIEAKAIPKVSVLLPVYNGAPWLADAIGCVLDQTLSDFELMVIDDGSTDDSWSVISRFSDHRLTAIRQANAGLAATLNLGLRVAKAPYVARQDQDDWMDPTRLARQYEFLEKNPDCVGAGTWAEILLGNERSGRYHCHPTHWDAIKLSLQFDNPFVHSSMMLRRNAVLAVGGYSEDRSRQPPEDYELWSRLARYGKLANIPETLTAYREVAGSMSRTGENPFLDMVIKIGGENIHHMLSGRVELKTCIALAACYHGVRLPDHQISLLQALSMLSKLKAEISHEAQTLSEEFVATHARIHRLLVLRFLSRYDVLGFVRIYRRIKKYL